MVCLYSSPISIASGLCILQLMNCVNKKGGEVIDNVLLGGLWFGDRKPSTLIFFKPFIGTLSILHAGITPHSPYINSDSCCELCYAFLSFRCMYIAMLVVIH